MGFPEIIFGICPVCGADGGDYAESDLDSADSTSNIDTTGNGVQLFEYGGEVMCAVCKNRLDADEESYRSAEKIAEEERFLRRAGFNKTAE